MTDINELKDFRSPGWDSLPEIELYMDQVLTLISKHFGNLIGSDSGITSSMINNYVKAGVVPPPHKKRYGKEHIACIFMVCVLKRVLSINRIGGLIKALNGERDIKDVYTLFCSELDSSVQYIKTVLSNKNGTSAAQPCKTEAELALRCSVSAFSNAVIADILLEDGKKAEKK